MAKRTSAPINPQAALKQALKPSCVKREFLRMKTLDPRIENLAVALACRVGPEITIPGEKRSVLSLATHSAAVCVDRVSLPSDVDLIPATLIWAYCQSMLDGCLRAASFRIHNGGHDHWTGEQDYLPWRARHPGEIRIEAATDTERDRARESIREAVFAIMPIENPEDG
jgi:hypothetical protein